jgi:hypothetical protein
MSDDNHVAECRLLADRLFEIIHQEHPSLALDALGMAMTRVLLGAIPAAGKTHRQIFEAFMNHTRLAGEHVMKVLDIH